MDVFQKLFEHDAAERSRQQAGVTDRRNAVQKWLHEGLNDVAQAARASGRMHVKQFSVLNGGTVEPVDLEGEVHNGNAFDTTFEFSFNISWDSENSTNVTVAAGGTKQELAVEEAIGLRPVDLLRDVLDAELERRRPAT
jgi:hypothetical protein